MNSHWSTKGEKCWLCAHDELAIKKNAPKIFDLKFEYIVVGCRQTKTKCFNLYTDEYFYSVGRQILKVSQRVLCLLPKHSEKLKSLLATSINYKQMRRNKDQ